MIIIIVFDCKNGVLFSKCSLCLLIFKKMVSSFIPVKNLKKSVLRLSFSVHGFVV